jgi:hypothetical protein
MARSSPAVSSVFDMARPPVSREVDNVIAALLLPQLAHLGAQFGELNVEIGTHFFLDRGYFLAQHRDETIKPLGNMTADLRLRHSVWSFQLNCAGFGGSSGGLPASSHAWNCRVVISLVVLQVHQSATIGLAANAVTASTGSRCCSSNRRRRSASSTRRNVS